MIRVNIITHDRPDEVLLLLADIARQAPDGTHVCVYEDPSDADYDDVRRFCDARNWWHVTANEHYGKERHYKLVGNVYATVRYVPAQATVFQLPDDIRLCDNFFDRALTLWSSVNVETRLALNLLRDARADGPCWTPVEPVDVGSVLRVGWVDGLFVADHKYYALLDYTVAPVSPNRWDHYPTLGSGVYQNVSEALYRQGAFYCVKQSLVVHTATLSKMNPAARAEHPLCALDFIDGQEAHDRLAGYSVPGDDS